MLIKEAPAEICDDCGEYYFDENTTDRVALMAEDAVRRKAEVEIVRFDA